MMIFIIGDQPSAKNLDPEVPFVGTASYKRLLEWIGRLDINITDTVLCNTENVKKSRPDWRPDVNLKGYTTEILEHDVVITLGEKAREYVEKELDIKVYYPLPHPSGRNRKLNDKKYINKVLKGCKIWLHGLEPSHQAYSL